VAGDSIFGRTFRSHADEIAKLGKTLGFDNGRDFRSQLNDRASGEGSQRQFLRKYFIPEFEKQLALVNPAAKDKKAEAHGAPKSLEAIDAAWTKAWESPAISDEMRKAFGPGTADTKEAIHLELAQQRSNRIAALRSQSNPCTDGAKEFGAWAEEGWKRWKDLRAARENQVASSPIKAQWDIFKRDSRKSKESIAQEKAKLDGELHLALHSREMTAAELASRVKFMTSPQWRDIKLISPENKDNFKRSLKLLQGTLKRVRTKSIDWDD